ncbi:MAG: radical SAM protein [Planctomycetota bacterium]|jgi:7-carboxy-7-deazaguanine synthase|nr:radical SAM protein [Planctomycetota bacterium]
MAQSLRVNEIFHSLQGESTHAGTPCAFIRLAGCNLNCSWCDTRYALSEPGRNLDIAMILAAIKPFGAPVAEITGGEPLLQAATPELARALAGEGYTTLVETNGSLDISVLPYPVVRIMDLKPPSSGMSDRNRFANFAHLRRGDEVKIVVADRVDYEWARTIITGGDYPGKTVTTLLSPLAARLAPATLAEWMLAEKLPARLNMQLHKYIWPAVERGV